jgi:hypothetical protein
MKLLIAVFIGITLKASAQNDSTSIYITSRFPEYGFGDNGVFRYKFKPKTIKRSALTASYGIASEADSVTELYYYSMKGKLNWNPYLVPVADSLVTGQPRIAILYSKDSTQTAFIDDTFLVSMNGKRYRLNEEGITYFLDLMPPDLKENWLTKERKLRSFRPKKRHDALDRKN